MDRMIEIRWHGRGGQGAKTAALILAEAALKEGKYVQAFPEYGPERMGAPMQSFTRISEVPIKLHSHITNPSAVVVLDSTLLDMVDVTEGLPEEGIILVNTSRTSPQVREKLNFNRGKVYTVDATSISLSALERNLPNIPMLGALIKATNLLKIETAVISIKEKMGKKFASRIIEGNVEALKRAYEEVKGE
ncbi:2-oxoacid:acceptor oxidoreductase family protein [Candidatus Aerophobetes bacterium]|nr:2-oxoacid:acceptor oxidoreductase family protein [Candidatus Aerophobetes bacterium]